MRVSTLHCAVLMAASATVLGACSNTDNENSSRLCETNVNPQATSPAPGALTLHGNFYPEESVILRYRVGTETRAAVGTPPDERTSFTLTGLPSGPVSYHIIISCAGGQDDLGSETYTVQ